IQAGNLLGMFLFMLQASQVQMVGPIDNKGDGEAENRDLPAQPMADNAETTCQGGANQIVWKRPEVTLFPDLCERLGLAQGNDTGNGKRVGYELRAGCGGHHQDWSHANTPQDGGVIDILG